MKPCTILSSIGLVFPAIALGLPRTSTSSTLAIVSGFHAVSIPLSNGTANVLALSHSFSPSSTADEPTSSTVAIPLDGLTTTTLGLPCTTTSPPLADEPSSFAVAIPFHGATTTILGQSASDACACTARTTYIPNPRCPRLFECPEVECDFADIKTITTTTSYKPGCYPNTVTSYSSCIANCNDLTCPTPTMTVTGGMCLDYLPATTAKIPNAAEMAAAIDAIRVPLYPYPSTYTMSRFYSTTQTPNITTGTFWSIVTPAPNLPLVLAGNSAVGCHVETLYGGQVPVRTTICPPSTTVCSVCVGCNAPVTQCKAY